MVFVARMMIASVLVFAGAMPTNAPSGRNTFASMQRRDVVLTNTSAGQYTEAGNGGHCNGREYEVELKPKVIELEKAVDDYKTAFESIVVAATDRIMELKKTAREEAAASKLTLEAALLKIADLELEVEERDARAAKVERDHAVAMESCEAQIDDLVSRNKNTKQNLEEVQSENQTSNRLGRDARSHIFEEKITCPHVENNLTEQIIPKLRLFNNSSKGGVSNARCTISIETIPVAANDRKVLDTKAVKANRTTEKQPLNQVLLANKTDLAPKSIPVEPKSVDLLTAVEESWGRGKDHPQSIQWMRTFEADWFPRNAQMEDCKHEIAPPGSEYVVLHGMPCYREFDWEETSAVGALDVLHWTIFFFLASYLPLLIFVANTVADFKRNATKRDREIAEMELSHANHTAQLQGIIARLLQGLIASLLLVLIANLANDTGSRRGLANQESEGGDEGSTDLNATDFDVDEFESMSYKEIQSLCKANKIKANGKRNVLIGRLVEFFEQKRS